MDDALSDAWESQLAALLGRLSAAQQELLSLLSQKRQHIINRDHAGLAALAAREHELADELRSCHRQREQLLAHAATQGIHGENLAQLADAVAGGDDAGRLRASVDAARQQSRLIRHESLSQWVAFQRSVLHLSQLLEIIATGGRAEPTYGKGSAPNRGGALIDQAI